MRVVAATNRNLEEMSSKGDFRTDLYYRLAAFVIEVPPLRQREEDIPAIIEHFLKSNSLANRLNKIMSDDAMRLMRQYPWPGNARELRNIVERSVILSGADSCIESDHLSFCRENPGQDGGLDLRFEHEPSLEQIEQQYLKMLIDRYQGHRMKIARILGVSERSVYRLMEKHGFKLQSSKCKEQ